jgi:phosphoribosylanthranilate isomerase
MQSENDLTSIVMRVKICGITTSDSLKAAIDAGAAYIGFNFFGKSPRYLDVFAVQALAQEVPPGVCKVGLWVNPTNAELNAMLAVVPLDMIQLHGSESVERVTQIKEKYGLPVMKVIGVSGPDDIAQISGYEHVADQILLDAKAPKDAILPGGNGLAFDWRLIAGRRFAVPWMLAGGLVPENVAEAVRLTGAQQVDVSSGVEASVGVKDNQLISDFIRAANGDV